ncbi:hypothetical protein FCV25MIE_07739 [Fagus crenata]
MVAAQPKLMPETNRGVASVNQSNIPQIYQYPLTENRKLGKGLTISLNERGIKRVSHNYKVEENSCAKWMPRVNVVSKLTVDSIGPNTYALVSLVGSHSRPTFNKGKSSGIHGIGMDNVGYGLELRKRPINPKPKGQTLSPDRVKSRLDKDKSMEMGHSLTGEISSSR